MANNAHFDALLRATLLAGLVAAVAVDLDPVDEHLRRELALVDGLPGQLPADRQVYDKVEPRSGC